MSNSCVVCYEEFQLLERKVYCKACMLRCKNQAPPWCAHVACAEAAGRKCFFCGLPLRFVNYNKLALFVVWAFSFFGFMVYAWFTLELWLETETCKFDASCPAYSFCMAMWYNRDMSLKKYWPQSYLFLFGECVNDYIKKSRLFR